MQPPVLVVIDVQLAADDPRKGARNNPDAEKHIADLLSDWRTAGAPVWHIRHDSVEPGSAYRPELPTNQFKPESMPLPEEPITGKQTNSAFIRTTFEADLRANGHRRLVMCGYQTNYCVESSARQAGNLGFETYVVEEACWTVEQTDLRGHTWRAEDVHQMALANLQGDYASVIDKAGALTLLQNLHE